MPKQIIENIESEEIPIQMLDNRIVGETDNKQREIMHRFLNKLSIFMAVLYSHETLWRCTIFKLAIFSLKAKV